VPGRCPQRTRIGNDTLIWFTSKGPTTAGGEMPRSQRALNVADPVSRRTLISGKSISGKSIAGESISRTSLSVGALPLLPFNTLPAGSGEGNIPVSAGTQTSGNTGSGVPSAPNTLRFIRFRWLHPAVAVVALALARERIRRWWP
jgi:hypothetical protein